MAQVMNYYRYPSYFDWDNMADTYATEASQTLIADIGEKVSMDYGPIVSLSNLQNASNAFVYYGYNSRIYEQDEYVSLDMLPMIKGGFSSSDSQIGHAWVWDGYRHTVTQHRYYVEYLNGALEYTNNYGETLIENPGRCGESSSFVTHHNWGYGGENDGWYTIPKYGNMTFNNRVSNLYAYPVQ